MINPGQKRLVIAPATLLKRLNTEHKSIPTLQEVPSENNTTEEAPAYIQTPAFSTASEVVEVKKKRGRPKGTTKAVMEQRKSGLTSTTCVKHQNTTTKSPALVQAGGDDEFVENLDTPNVNTKVVTFNATGEVIDSEDKTPPYPAKGTAIEQADWIESYGPTFQGKREIIKLYRGEPISAREAIRAKCYDCMGFYQDGRGDCTSSDSCSMCPLYPFYPFSTKARHLAKKKNINPTWLHKTVEEGSEGDGEE